MNQRVNAFANLNDLPAFEIKPKIQRPVSKEAVDQLAEENNFVSREPVKAPRAAKRKEQRRYRTGRNQHLGIKATAETRDRFHKIVDERKLPGGEVLRLALDALERVEGAG